MEEILILQQTEFQILAAIVNLNKVYGIQPKEELDEKLFMYGVHEMTEKGILKKENGKFAIQEPYRTVMLSIRNAENVLAVTGKTDETGNTGFYFGEKLIVLEESIQDAAALRIGVFEPEDLYTLLEEKEFLPMPLLDPDIAELQTEEELMEDLDGKELPIYAGYKIIRLRDGAVREKTIQLILNPYNYWIMEEEDGDSRFYRYTREDLFEKLKQELYSE